MAASSRAVFHLLPLLLLLVTSASAARRPPPTKAQIKAEVSWMAKRLLQRYPQYSKFSKDFNKYVNLASQFCSLPLPPCFVLPASSSLHHSPCLILPKSTSLLPLFSVLSFCTCPSRMMDRLPAFPTFLTILNSKYNFSALADATLLIPSNTAAKALSKRLPLTSKNIPKAYNVTAYHIIAKRFILPKIKAMRAGQPLPTQLRQALYKLTGRNGSVVMFGTYPSTRARGIVTIRMVIPGMYVGPYFIAHGVDRVLLPRGTRV
ncbi:unnamed protein product [Closterium sp. Naga37s-1]|nr:unnamed protein product [Closterium sp. Naga37s-1]